MSAIDYVDVAWNVVTGCSNDGCPCRADCWAMRMARRMAENSSVQYRERYEGFKPAFWPERLDQPQSWKKPRVVFVASMGDWCDLGIKDSERRLIFEAMRKAPQHVYLFLTKRGEWQGEFVRENFQLFRGLRVWFGISVWDQKSYLAAVLALVTTYAAGRWISLEPILGPVSPANAETEGPERIDWLVAGGGSGQNTVSVHPYRPGMLRNYWVDRKISFYWKQWGEWGGYSAWQNAGCPRVENHIVVHTSLCDGSGVEMHRLGKKLSGCRINGQEIREMPPLWSAKIIFLD